MGAKLKRFAVSGLFAIGFLAAAGPWALYWLGQLAVSGKPAAAQVGASREQQLVVWQMARGTGEPHVLAVNPYTYLPRSLERGSHRPSLLLAWWVATEHYDKHRRYQGNLWRQLSCGALSIWLTSTWSTEQLLSKVAELNAENKSAA